MKGSTMSRTLRRTGKNVDPNGYLHTLTHTPSRDWLTPNWVKKTTWCYCNVSLPLHQDPLTGKDFRKGYWEYHRDHSNNFNGSTKLYRKDWGAVRSNNRNNLAAGLSKEDSDIFFWEDLNTKDWS